ncbi:hypothetical protein G7B40_001500 [Aetokthonos hydrillicola Thurmond2011]|jgi:hypothetical protein|uniref:Uncharacterized protein n=1 Tax=Aetokthonos hydrillicola Thurmond2011 TaxID=2712845 RepID=A0AAP5I1V6_9CYAN|nr:hypothetical protein [Aetokthonos hydrillicola CCALA 1050]MDR9893261.1 hypothetical protein [Aetokthonos hydrillicola Thurmond2011]
MENDDLTKAVAITLMSVGIAIIIATAFKAMPNFDFRIYLEVNNGNRNTR